MPFRINSEHTLRWESTPLKETEVKGVGNETMVDFVQEHRAFVGARCPGRSHRELLDLLEYHRFSRPEAAAICDAVSWHGQKVTRCQLEQSFQRIGLVEAERMAVMGDMEWVSGGPMACACPGAGGNVRSLLRKQFTSFLEGISPDKPLVLNCFASGELQTEAALALVALDKGFEVHINLIDPRYATGKPYNSLGSGSLKRCAGHLFAKRRKTADINLVRVPRFVDEYLPAGIDPAALDGVLMHTLVDDLQLRLAATGKLGSIRKYVSAKEVPAVDLDSVHNMNLWIDHGADAFSLAEDYPGFAKMAGSAPCLILENKRVMDRSRFEADLKAFTSRFPR